MTRGGYRPPDPFARVKTLLSIWGRWAIRSASGALGFPACSPMFRDAPRSDVFGSRTPLGITDGISPEIYLIDEEVARLPTVQMIAVVEMYQRGGSMREIASRMGVKADAVKHWIGRAHESLSQKIDNAETGVHNSHNFDRLDNSA